jgi:hypothetical protein
MFCGLFLKNSLQKSVLSGKKRHFFVPVATTYVLTTKKRLGETAFTVLSRTFVPIEYCARHIKVIINLYICRPIFQSKF